VKRHLLKTQAQTFKSHLPVSKGCPRHGSQASSADADASSCGGVLLAAAGGDFARQPSTLRHSAGQKGCHEGQQRDVCDVCKQEKFVKGNVSHKIVAYRCTTVLAVPCLVGTMYMTLCGTDCYVYDLSVQAATNGCHASIVSQSARAATSPTALMLEQQTSLSEKAAQYLDG
jgi:hypothetical protein